MTEHISQEEILQSRQFSYYCMLLWPLLATNPKRICAVMTYDDLHSSHHMVSHLQ